MPAQAAALREVHPAFFVIDLFAALSCPAAPDQPADDDALVMAYLLRVACVDGLPDDLRDLARAAYPVLASRMQMPDDLDLRVVSRNGH